MWRNFGEWQVPQWMQAVTEMKRRIVYLLLFLIFLLTCGITDVVRKGAEPIDRQGCRVDCARKGYTYLSYDYWDNRCKCTDANGDEIILYEWREE